MRLYKWMEGCVINPGQETSWASVRSGMGCWKAPRTWGPLFLCLDWAPFYTTGWVFLANRISLLLRPLGKLKIVTHSFQISIINLTMNKGAVLSPPSPKSQGRDSNWPTLGKSPPWTIELYTHGFSLVPLLVVQALSTLRILFLKFVFDLPFLPPHKVSPLLTGEFLRISQKALNITPLTISAVLSPVHPTPPSYRFFYPFVLCSGWFLHTLYLPLIL